MSSTWIEVASQETLDRLLPTLMRRKPSPKPSSMIDDPGYLKIKVRRYPGRERIEVEFPTPPCGHRGDWTDARKSEYARGLTEVRALSDYWSHSRYPNRHVWRADFHCGSSCV